MFQGVSRADLMSISWHFKKVKRVSMSFQGASVVAQESFRAQVIQRRFKDFQGVLEVFQEVSRVF